MDQYEDFGPTYADYGPPASLADAHREWHYVHGNVVCPLDCGIGEPQYDWNEDTQQWDPA